MFIQIISFSLKGSSYLKIILCSKLYNMIPHVLLQYAKIFPFLLIFNHFFFPPPCFSSTFLPYIYTKERKTVKSGASTQSSSGRTSGHLESYCVELYSPSLRHSIIKNLQSSSIDDLTR